MPKIEAEHQKLLDAIEAGEGVPDAFLILISAFVTALDDIIGSNPSCINATAQHALLSEMQVFKAGMRAVGYSGEFVEQHVPMPELAPAAEDNTEVYVQDHPTTPKMLPPASPKKQTKKYK